MPQFRKKPVVIEAVQWLGTTDSFNELKNLGYPHNAYEAGAASITIPTLEGEMLCSKNDWVIRGIHGEFYPCKPDIFEKTYEKVES